MIHRNDIIIGVVLEMERERQGLSVYELAKRSEMSAGRVHDILDGTTANPGILTLARVLAALGRNLAWLERAMNGNQKHSDKNC